jgi:hypothetical protein
MSIPTYAVVNDLPAPVTTGSTIQSFTDVLGDVWVAKNGVSGGAWARARAVLYCRCYRGAAYNTPAINATFVYDTAVDDVYGLFASPGINLPIPGYWMAGATIEIVPTAVSDTCAFYLNLGTNSLRSGSAAATSALNPIRAIHSAVANVPSVPATLGVATEYMTASRAVAAQDGRTMLWAKYVGA